MTIPFELMKKRRGETDLFLLQAAPQRMTRGLRLWIPVVALDVDGGVSLAALGSKLLDSMKSAVECSTIESNALLEHAMTQIVDGLSIIQLAVLPWQAPDLFEAYAYEVADTVDAFEDKAADLLQACAFEGADIVVGA
ncbi:hypothetical protein LWI29_021678 [Acer saccharum]|uniref:Uncharacterized protein n=1 Tax=Acer saccharum TaxID=4024 RepID=A0AA39VDZ6_ACESA|nr:hypothetical protein LWI29_021678 [Acer saccharum]